MRKDFSTTHEREFWNEFSKLFENEFSSKNDKFILIGNINCDGKELDALVIKNDAIIIVDFKEGGGKIKFSEKEKWTREDGTDIKGGSSTNPLFQIKSYKYTLCNFLENLKEEYQDIKNSKIEHTSGVVLFRDSIEFDKSNIPGSIRPWFHISDKITIIEKINSITSRDINLTNDFLIETPKLFGIIDNNQLQPVTPIIASPILVKKHKLIKKSEVERILDYYITCLEQEDLKNLYLRADFKNGDIINGNNYSILDNSFNEFLPDNQNEITSQFNDQVNKFINEEFAKPNPRNLFFGFPTIAYTDSIENKTYLYPKYYCQLVQDEITNKYKRLNDNECILNKYYLVRAGTTDREEIESIVDEINKLNSFEENL